ncbi:hypothetical protein RvY_19074-1 [Ramazzottius varieornatus]|uniref:Uncharacterized protein n=1 Tax=Ramazzottius varieornatus TaxID=947166 RepID=A0A1D1W9F7_RAMVA|nr:hypothetical protein RvY_19074-1 [Ramazzottius varieornatus]
MEGNNDEIVEDGPVNNPYLLATSDSHPVIKLRPSQKFVRSLTEDIAKKYGFTGIRMQSSALFALPVRINQYKSFWGFFSGRIYDAVESVPSFEFQTAAEDYLVNVVKEARIYSEHAGHDFLTQQDFAMGVRVVGMGGK